MTKYAFLGTGALGGLYGGLLARSAQEVCFLARSDYLHLKSHGLQIDTPLGNFQLAKPNVYRSAEDMPSADVVVVAWKATSNDHLRSALESICEPNSIVLVLQNGLDVERDAAAVVGEDRVLGGCCFLCSNKIGPGHIKHLDFGRIVFGEYGADRAGQITNRMLKIAQDFQNAGIDMKPAADFKSVRWNKLAWNIPFNGLSVVLGADTSQIMNSSTASQIAEALMREVQAAASACGVSVDDSHILKLLNDTRKMVPYDSSMLLDYRARRPMEVEAIFGNPLRAAQAAGYNPPRIEMLYQQLCFLDDLRPRA